MRTKLFSVSIHDCRVEALASTGGAGGQNKNRRHTAIRITHPPSGAVGFSADEREQHRNKVVAFERLAHSPTFRDWCRAEAARRMGKPSIEDRVDAEMGPENLLVEVRDKDRWERLE